MKLEIFRKKLKNVDSSVFDSYENVENIEHLILSWIEVEQIATNTFEKLTSLKKISLVENCIKKLDNRISKSFKHVNGLEELDLSSNQIEEISPDAFEGLGGNLKKLDLSVNHLSRIGAHEFQHLSQLEELNLGYNPIERIDSRAFVKLNNLKKFDIREIKSTTIYGNIFESLNCLNNLEDLNLSLNHTKIVELVDFEKLISLKKFWFSPSRESEEFNETIFKLVGQSTKLDELSLIRMEDAKLEPRSFEKLKNLKKLTLLWRKRSIKIDSDVYGIFNYTNKLKELKLDGGTLGYEFEIEPKAFESLSNLKILRFEFFHFGQIDLKICESFEGLRNLEELYFYICHVEKLDSKAFRKLKKLKKLTIIRNELGRIDSNTFQSIEIKLNELDLTSNKIDIIDSNAFEKLTNLKSLNLSYNQLRLVNADNFRSFSANSNELRELNLGWNHIGAILPRAFCTLDKLKSLYLNDNNLERLNSDAFALLSSLETLDLSRNRIEEIDERAYVHMSGLRVLALAGNRLKKLSRATFQYFSSASIALVDLSDNKFNAKNKIVSYFEENVSENDLVQKFAHKKVEFKPEFEEFLAQFSDSKSKFF